MTLMRLMPWTSELKGRAEERARRDVIFADAVHIVSISLASPSFLTGSTEVTGIKGPLTAGSGVAPGVTPKWMPEGPALPLSVGAVRSQRVGPWDPLGMGSTLSLAELVIVAIMMVGVVRLVLMAAMAALVLMGLVVPTTPPPLRAFILRYLDHPILFTGLAEGRSLVSARRLLRPLANELRNLLITRLTMAIIGTCPGEATRPGCTCPTSGQAVVQTVSSLRDARCNYVAPALLHLHRVRAMEIETMDAAVTRTATQDRNIRRWRTWRIPQFEGGLSSLCSRLGRALWPHTTLGQARTQFEGGINRLGPMQPLPTPRGLAWSPASPPATPSCSGRWRTTRSGSQRGSGRRAPGRAAIPPSAWPPFARALPPG